jgi:hypothetical protein
MTRTHGAAGQPFAAQDRKRRNDTSRQPRRPMPGPREISTGHSSSGVNQFI